MGPGKVTIEFIVGSPGVGELRSTLTCGPDEPTQKGVLRVNTRAPISLKMDPDGRAARRAMYAYSAVLSAAEREQLRNAAAAAVGLITGADSVFLDGPVRLEEKTLADGPHLLRFACMPDGDVVLSLRLKTGSGEPGTVVERQNVTCDGGIADVPFTKARGRTVEVDVEPDANSSGQAAMAYRIEAG